MTSNPTIFEKALAEGHAYDDQLSAAPAGRTAMELFELVETTDVRDACDLFMPVYERTNGGDGYVSIEVSPGVGERRAGDGRRSAAALVDGRPAERDDQGARHRRRRRRRAAAHRRRHQRQHHAALRHRGAPPRDRGVPRGPRGQARGRQADRSRRVRRELLRQPGGHGDRQAARRDGRDARRARSASASSR